MKRTGQMRLDAIPAAMARREDFFSRVALAEGDAVKCADLMAEAIMMDRESRSLEIVGRDGRHTFSMERLVACHCLDAACTAYIAARRFNEPKSTPQNQSKMAQNMVGPAGLEPATRPL